DQADRAERIGDLPREPEANQYEGRHSSYRQKRAEDEKRAHDRTRIEQDVAAEHSRDRTTCPDERIVRAREDDGEDKTGEDTADQIEDEIGQVSELILDVITEDPEEEHVARDMQQTAVQEDGGDNRNRVLAVPEIGRCEAPATDEAVDARLAKARF